MPCRNQPGWSGWHCQSAHSDRIPILVLPADLVDQPVSIGGQPLETRLHIEGVILPPCPAESVAPQEICSQVKADSRRPALLEKCVVLRGGVIAAHDANEG